MTDPIGCRLGGPDGRSGRLGNMLLRVAAAIGLAKRYGTEPRFENDWSYRSMFSLPDEWFVPLDELEQLQQACELPEVAHLPESYRHYLQDVSLWWEHRELVREVLRLSPWAQTKVDEAATILDGMPHPILAVHVRRGDNVTNEAGTINCLPASYYVEAIKSAKCERYSNGRRWEMASVLIVSDDPEWCETEFVPRHVAPSLPVRVLHGGRPRLKEHDPGYLRETPSDWVDLFVLADRRCSAIVLSNSTFALWGAVLGGYANPYRPSYWVGRQLTDQGIRPDLLFPKEWDRVIPVADPAPLDKPDLTD